MAGVSNLPLAELLPLSAQALLQCALKFYCHLFCQWLTDGGTAWLKGAFPRVDSQDGGKASGPGRHPMPSPSVDLAWLLCPQPSAALLCHLLLFKAEALPACC